MGLFGSQKTQTSAQNKEPQKEEPQTVEHPTLGTVTFDAGTAWARAIGCSPLATHRSTVILNFTATALMNLGPERRGPCSSFIPEPAEVAAMLDFAAQAAVSVGEQWGIAMLTGDRYAPRRVHPICPHKSA